MALLSPFDEVIRDFAQAEYLPRLKKLLVYACTQQWESDPDRLAQQNLHTLIETLMQIAPTLEQLKTYLDQVTQSLSKPAEYLLIANAIVQGLRKLYVGTGVVPAIHSNPHLYWQVAQVLEEDPEHLRMRKLLILLCRNHWELDTNRLLAESLPDLVCELHQLTQSMDNLQAVFDSIVQNTSKPVQYGAIATRIIAACQILYSAQQSDSHQNSQTELRLSAPGVEASPPITPLVGSSPSHRFQANGLQANGSKANGSNARSSPPPPLPPNPKAASGNANRAPTTGIYWVDSPASSVEQDESAPAEVSDPAMARSDNERSQSEAASEPIASQASSSTAAAVSATIPTFTQGELFDLRLEIMKYTVPLLAKQLLFLTLYAPVEYNSEVEVAEMATDSETWAGLKKRDLDDLIEGTLKQYPTLTMLEEGLHRSARLSQDEERSTPVASAIVRAVKTLMAKHHPERLPQRSAEGNPGLRKAEQTRQVVLPTVSLEPQDADPRQRPKPPPSSAPSSATLNQDDTLIKG
ncbi:MAG: hypothetical protein WBA57_09065 [Elainellaceae cyanobacterium]